MIERKAGLKSSVEPGFQIMCIHNYTYTYIYIRIYNIITIKRLAHFDGVLKMFVFFLLAVHLPQRRSKTASSQICTCNDSNPRLQADSYRWLLHASEEFGRGLLNFQEMGRIFGGVLGDIGPEFCEDG